MKKLELLIRYILLNYPLINELSKPRLVKIIYLIDWKYAIDYGKQYTEINWFFNHYGPYVDDVIKLMKEKPSVFKVNSNINSLGGVTDRFFLIDNTPVYIDNDIKNVADYIISNTYKLNWSEFINLVYSSYPIKNNLKYSNLDLNKLSSEFRELKKQ